MEACIKRDHSLDFIKVLATVFVIKLHSGGSSFFAEIIHYISGVAIPLFLMVSGALILNKNKVDYYYAIKKIVNVFVVMILWSIIIAVGHFAVSHTFVNPLSYLWRAFVQEGVLAHFWYLWMLIPIYMVCPILVKYLHTKRSICLTMIILLGVCTVFAINTMLSGANGIEAQVPQASRIWIPLMYFLCGGLIYRFKNRNCDKIKTKMDKYKAIYYVIVVLWITIALLEKKVLANVIQMHSPEYLFSNPIVICFNSCLFFFLVIVNFGQNNKKFGSLIERLSQDSFGVYILHMFLIDLANKLIPDMNWLVKVVLVLVCSFTISAIIRRIPFVRRLVTY